jgi:hypothetical protein
MSDDAPTSPDPPETAREHTTDSDAPGNGKTSSEFSTLRVARVLIPLVVLAGLAGGFVALDGVTWVGSLFQPPLVPAKGSLFYKGKPLVGAMVTTQPLRSGIRGALAETDEYGQFELQTDVQGKYVKGAYAGTHKLMIAVYEPSAGPGPPRLMSPPKFVSAGASPLVIKIDSGSDLNEFPFRLDDFLDEEESAAADATGTAPNQQDEMLEMILSRNDADQDGALNMEEIETIPEQYRDRMRRADINGDGLVDRPELRSMLGAPAAEAPAPESPEAKSPSGASPDPESSG